MTTWRAQRSDVTHREDFWSAPLCRSPNPFRGCRVSTSAPSHRFSLGLRSVTFTRFFLSRSFVALCFGSLSCWKRSVLAEGRRSGFHGTWPPSILWST